MKEKILYSATVTLGPVAFGQIYSAEPIRETYYNSPAGPVDGVMHHSMVVKECRMHRLETPDVCPIVPWEIAGIIDRARRGDPGYRLLP